MAVYVSNQEGKITGSYPNVSNPSKYDFVKYLPGKGFEVYTTKPADASEDPSPTKDPPRYTGGGGSGGGGLNLKIYRRRPFKASKYKKSARTMADADIRTGRFANQRSRNEADTRYQSNMRSMELERERNIAQNEREQAATLAANANLAMNRGMGYGQGVMNTQSNTRLGYGRMLNDLLDQYLVQQQNALSERDRIFGDMDEADRLLDLNRQATILKYYQDLMNSGFNRYLGIEGLRQQEIDSANRAIAAR